MPYKLALFGPGGVGKTVFTHLLLHKTLPSYTTTTSGVEIHRWSNPSSESEFILYDTASHIPSLHRTANIWSKADLFIVFVDATKDTVDLESWVATLRRYSTTTPIAFLQTKTENRFMHPIAIHAPGLLDLGVIPLSKSPNLAAFMTSIESTHLRRTWRSWFRSQKLV